ncbi:skin secretory protein xP2-like [Saccopteryx bilineata]|uniref:skin secretory protein xP2-like n=1 Tax=Saccopteryx bilineata TaxID=59482 RepID=UPI00338FE4AC
MSSSSLTSPEEGGVDEPAPSARPCPASGGARRSADCAKLRGGGVPLCGWGLEPAVSEAEARRWLRRTVGRPASRPRNRPARKRRDRSDPASGGAPSPPWSERWLGPAAAERALGDGGAAAPRPEAPKAGKPGSSGTRRSPGTAGTLPCPPGELPLRIPPRVWSPAVPPLTDDLCYQQNRPPVVPAAPPRGPARPAPSRPFHRLPAGAPLPSAGPSVRDSSSLSSPGSVPASVSARLGALLPLRPRGSAAGAPLIATCAPPPLSRVPPSVSLCASPRAHISACLPARGPKPRRCCCLPARAGVAPLGCP